MIAKLRQKHKIIWIAIGVVLPLSFIWITQTLSNDNFKPEKIVPNTSGIPITVQKSQDKVKIEITEEVRCAFCKFYADRVSTSTFLGDVSSSNRYEYKLENAGSLQRIILFDEIKKQEIYTIDL